jgi:hypothetical protein
MIEADVLSYLTPAELAELDALLAQPTKDERWLPLFEEAGREALLDRDPEWLAALAAYRDAIAAARSAGIPPTDWHAYDWIWIGAGGKVLPQTREYVDCHVSRNVYRVPAVGEGWDRLADLLTRGGESGNDSGYRVRP